MSTKASYSRKRKADPPTEPIPMEPLEAVGEEDEVEAEAVEEGDFSFARNAPEGARIAYNETFRLGSCLFERGVDEFKVSQNIKDMISFYNWKKFVTSRKEKVNRTLVAEFYAMLSQAQTAEDLDNIVIRKVKMSFNSKVINSFYGIPEIDPKEHFATKWGLDKAANDPKRSEEARKLINPVGSWADSRLNFDDCSKDFKVIKHIIAYNLVATSHTAGFTFDEAVLALALTKREKVDTGKLICDRVVEVAKAPKEGGWLLYSCLISALCLKAKVPTLPTDQYFPPVRTLIGSHIHGPKATKQPPSTSTTPTIPSPPLTLENRVENIESNMSFIMNTLVAMDSRLLRTCTFLEEASNDIRMGLREQREFFEAFANVSVPNREDFYRGSENPYTFERWTPITLPIPTTTTTMPTSSSIPTPVVTSGVPSPLFAGPSLSGTAAPTPGAATSEIRAPKVENSTISGTPNTSIGGLMALHEATNPLFAGPSLSGTAAPTPGGTATSEIRAPMVENSTISSTPSTPTGGLMALHEATLNEEDAAALHANLLPKTSSQPSTSATIKSEFPL